MIRSYSISLRVASIRLMRHSIIAALTWAIALLFASTCRSAEDPFGIQMIEATIDGGREWFAEWPTVPEDRWLGMKYVVRNCHENQHVRLQLYLDETAANNWVLIADYTDSGGWRGEQQSCNRAID